MASKLDLKALETKLSNPQTTTAELHDIVAQVGLSGKFRPGRIFPIGIVVPDGVRGRIDVAPADLGALVERLVDSSSIRSWRVFPIGIVAPDRFAVEVDVGRPFAVVSGG